MSAEKKESTDYLDLIDLDEKRRAYVLECMTACGDASAIDGKVFVCNLNFVTEWLRSATVPAQVPKPKAMPQMKTV